MLFDSIINKEDDNESLETSDQTNHEMFENSVPEEEFDPQIKKSANEIENENKIGAKNKMDDVEKNA